MIINADTLLPHLKDKVRPMHSDASRHLICPECGIRTKLHTLADGRKKCSVCGKKFRVHKVTDDIKLKQCAEILLCFCLDFSAHKSSQVTHHRYRLVAGYYEHFRNLLTMKNLPKEKIPLLSTYKKADRMDEDATRCRWCHSHIKTGKENRPPVFGIQFKESGEVYIDPLKDDEAVFHFHTFGEGPDTSARLEGYAGFICCGKFHRFTKDGLTKMNQEKDGAEQVWTWIRQRVQTHHGIWNKNTGFYLKELEWKYNNRSLDPELQAKKIIDLMPADFLTEWKEQK